MSLPKILILAGATASGKTAVASEIAKKIPVEMISFDSMQVYRSMPIVTQAPPARPKTHLTNFLSPAEEYSAALFRKDAAALIEKILKKKKTPLLAGGTGLYYRALLDGLFESEGDSRDEALRARLAAEQERHGGNYLHERLQKVDEASAKKIHPNDFRRLIRALEVYELTGRPISEQKPNRSGLRGFYDCRAYFLDRDRAELYARINRRVDRMFRAGLVKEVTKLRRLKLSQTAGMALGVREVCAYLDKKMTLAEAKELLKKKTRNYAKRQLSWFRYEKDVEWIAVESGDTNKMIASKILRSFKGETKFPPST